MPRPSRARKPAVTDLESIPEAPEEWRTPVDAAPLDPPDRDRVVAIATDSRSVHVYWTVTAAAVGRARATLDGPARLVLRVYVGGEEGTGATRKSYPATEWIGERLVTVRLAGARVVAAVGFESAEGFAHLARASAVRLPRGTPGPAPVEMTSGAPPATDPTELARFTMTRARRGVRFVDLGELA